MEPRITELIQKFNSEVVVLADYRNKKDFKQLIDEYYGYIKEGFEILEFRTCPVNFRINQPGEPQSDIHSMEVRHFVTNLMFWEPLAVLEKFEDLSTNHFVDAKGITSKSIEAYVNNYIILPYRKEIGNRRLNTVIHDMIHRLSRISTDFNMILGLSINAETFMEVADKNEEFNQIIRTHLPEDMQPREIEQVLDQNMKDMVRILLEEDNMIRPFLRVGSGIKDKQLAEFAINGGLKPDLDGSTIPMAINSNMLVGGYNSVAGHYIDANGGRKSIIMNSTVMGTSGHFARMIMMSSSGQYLDASVMDCQTVNPLTITIKTKEHLTRLKGRYVRGLSSPQYVALKGDETHLIGATVLLRSPITCANDKICCKCYGELYNTNEDLNSVGGYAGTKITEPLSQMILSSKHLLNTDSEELKFHKTFNLLFSISANEILVNHNTDENISDYALVLDFNDGVDKIYEFDDTDYNMFVKAFDVLHIPTGELLTFEELSKNELFLHQNIFNHMTRLQEQTKAKETNPNSFFKNGKMQLSLEDLEHDDVLFVTVVMNNELTRPLNEIRDLLRLSDHNGLKNDVDKIAQKLFDLLIESHIPSDSVHGEIIIRPLVRRADNILKRPRFRQYEALQEVQVLTIPAALEHNPSVQVSLSFQYLKRQLASPITYEKHETSFIDPFFKHQM